MSKPKPPRYPMQLHAEWRGIHIFTPTVLPERSFISENGDGSTEEEWRSECRRARRVRYFTPDPDRVLYEDSYYFETGSSRLDGPARTTFRPDGSVIEEEWYRDNRLSRLDGPAIVHYDEYGEVIGEEWWFIGELFDDPADIGERFAELSGERAYLEVKWSSFARFLDAGHDYEAVAAVIRGGVLSAEGIAAVLGGAPLEWVRSFEAADPDTHPTT